MSSSGRRSSPARWLSARVPVRATYLNLYSWPESDTEFVKSVVKRGGGDHGGGSDADANATTSATTATATFRRQWAGSPAVVDSYSSRQTYLRSYQFTTKETVPEKTRRCLGKVREKALFPRFLQWRRRGGYVVNGKSFYETNRTKKGCLVAVKKLREASILPAYSVFRRLLCCAAPMDRRRQL